MSLKLIKEAVIDSNFSSTKKRTISMLESIIGKKSTRRIVESYQVSPDDYTQWLEVIKGYAADEGINIRTKSAFADTAFAVLENDPAPLAEDMKEAIVNTLWAHYKAEQQHSKVLKAGRAQEEEEQLKYALRKMRNRSEENEESGFGQMLKASLGTEEEEYDDVDDTEEYDYEDDTETHMPMGMVSHLTDLLTTGMITYDQFKTKLNKLEGFKRRGRSASKVDQYEFEDEEFGEAPDEFDPRELDTHFGNESSVRSRSKQNLPRRDEVGNFDEDRNIIQRGNQMRKSRDVEDFDQSSDEGMDRDVDLMRKAKSQPKSYYATENEEQTGYASPFAKGQLVSCKKDGNTYKVEIPDGPGDAVGVMVGGRIKMVPAKDLEVPHASEEEETTSKQSKGTASFLHDVLHQTNSTANLKKLQDQIENDAANAWTQHHARLPKNPHERGSIAYKSWEKGIKKAATDIWAPKLVVLDNKVKPKAKTKKK